MQLTLRVKATPEQAEALMAEWLHGAATIKVQTGTADMDLPLTYVKEHTS